MKFHNHFWVRLILPALCLSILSLTACVAETDGGLTVHPDGHYFTYNSKPVFLFGAGNWVIIPDGHRRHPFPTDYDWIHRTVSQYGANSNRSGLYAFGNPQTMPWVFEDGLYDLDRWNEAFWTRLHDYLTSAKKHDIVPIIQIFDHPSAKPNSDPERWAMNPFNPDNNVNDMGGLDADDYVPERDFYNAENRQLMAYKSALVWKLIDETHDYGNIIYQLDNEHPFGVEGWADTLLAVFREGSRKYGRPFLVSNMTMSHHTQMDHVHDDRITVIEAFHTYDTGGYAEEVDFQTMHTAITDLFYEGGGKPVILGRGSIVPARGQGFIETMRREWFVALIAGGQIIAPRVVFDMVNEDPEAFHEPTLEVIRSVHLFADEYPFWTMRPVRRNIDGAYVMKTPDARQMAIYSPYPELENPIILNLRELAKVEPGTSYTLKWYDPSKQVFLPARQLEVDSQGRLVLEAPGENPDWAAVLRQDKVSHSNLKSLHKSPF